MVIPIAIFTRIDASTASSSAFQIKSKSVHDHAGIRVHVRLESAFTMRWKPRSPSTGICTLEPEQMTELSNLNIRVIEETVSLIEALPGATVRLTTNTGAALTFDTIYPMIGCEPRVELLQDLKARQDSFRQLWVDEHQQTSISGIYATGDVVHALNQMTVGAAHAATAATAIHNLLPKNYWDAPRDSSYTAGLQTPPHTP